MMRPLSSKRRKAAALAYNGIGSPTVVAKAVDEDADLLVEAGRASNIPVLYDLIHGEKPERQKVEALRSVGNLELRA